MIHKRQMTNYSCGAAAFSIVTGIPERESIELCKTNIDGTSMACIYGALKRLNKLPHLVHINQPIEECWWLENQKFPLIVSGFFKTRYHKRGRARERHHAFAIKNGTVYDPSENRTFPIEAYYHVFDKLHIKSMIIVEKP